VEAEIVDVSGRTVRRLARGYREAGEHRLGWDGRGASGGDAGPGVYWAVVRTDQGRLVRRVVRLK
jgi:flagellar hook assembly protein FlgD